MLVCVYLSLLSCALAAVTGPSVMEDCRDLCDLQEDPTSETVKLWKLVCHCFNITYSTFVSEAASTPKSLPYTQKAITTPTTETTTSICEALCSIQMGGDACNCGVPSLPGK